MLLAGVGNVDTRHKKNFFLVDESIPQNVNEKYEILFHLETQNGTIEEAFEDLVSRKDIAVLLINQHVPTHCREGQLMASVLM